MTEFEKSADEAITTSKADKFGRAAFAEALAKALVLCQIQTHLLWDFMGFWVAAKKMFTYVARAIESIGISLMSYKLPKYWSAIHVDQKATVFDRKPRFEIRVG